MVSESDRNKIRAKFATEPDPDQLELLADETLEPLPDRRLSQSKARRQPMRKARSHE